MKKVRTRFAPSPTGRMHVGNLRTALYAYLIAKHEGGDFLLRIEDTDQERFVDGALEIIYRTLEKTGLVHDEGPDKDGGCGPYVQSERQAQGIYLKYAKELIDKGEAYYCFCDKERLDSLKQEVAGKEIVVYDKHCLSLSKEEVEEKLASGVPYVIRQNNPTTGTTTFSDEIYGDITVDNAELDDMILIKSDGYPTYNFANVVDDHLMGITHVVRGNEYLSSSPKYTRLYQAFGWEEPVYVHCPLITDENHKKLSKRSGHSSFEDLIDQGFVTEAVVNYVALLGWCPEDNREIFSLEELVQAFDYHHMSKSPAVFDIQKLRWMNGEYLKAMDSDRFYEMAEPYIREVIRKPLDLKKIAAMVKTRIEVFPDIAGLIDFFEALPDYDTAMYAHKKMKTTEESSLEVLKELLPVLEAQEDYSNDALYALLQNFAKEKGCKNGYVLWPVRTAVSGKQMTPAGATEIMEIIGKDETIARVKKGIEKLVFELNQYQTMAVSHKDGPALVLAGPGSGKTLVITHRIKKLIEEYGAAPERILVITFTRAAAMEMKTRFEALMGGRHLPVSFGTFHSVYFGILKYAYRYDASQIIGEEGRLRLLSEELSRLEPSMAEEGMEFLESVLSEISTVKNDMLDIGHYYAKSCPEELFRRLYEAYEMRLRKEQVIDFDDMLLLCHELFTARKDILSRWQQRFQYILCDEFQDINRIQYEILKMLALPENNLFAVGDDDQAIYRFRGARPELMLGFEREFPGAARYLLAVNYRCSEKIIRAAGNLISHNQVRFKKDISGTGKEAGPVILGKFPEAKEENDRILAHVTAYHREGYAYEEMAVLVRTNTGARKILGTFMEYSIPFQTKDAVPSLYDHWICGDIRAYIRAAMGDESRQVLMRIINKPCRYISRSVFSGGDTDLDQIEAIYEEKPWMAERIRELQEDLRAVYKSPPFQAVRYIRRKIGYDEYLRTYCKERHMEEKELSDILDELQADAGEYQTFAAWFAHMDRYREEMKKQKETDRKRKKGVVVSTMHGAKGLEYAVVFLPDVNEKVVPHEKAGLSADLEEERRLFYVAMTRAKEKLHIYSVGTHHGKESVPSRFVTELKYAAEEKEDAGRSGTPWEQER